VLEMLEEMLRKAVFGKNLVEFCYEGGIKVIEPHMVAHNMTGHILLNGWFAKGDKKFGEEGWQNYMLAGISNLKILPDTFAKARFGYNPFDSKQFANIQFCL
jgi:hypothetical protein